MEVDSVISEKKDLEKSLQAKHGSLLKLQADLRTEVEGYERRMMSLEESSKRELIKLQEEVSSQFDTVGFDKILKF